MYHPPSKRKQLVQRTVIYSAMTLAVITLVVVLVFIMLGYQFNGQDGRVEQGGLVQFDSLPEGGTVTVDGRAQGSRTPSKATLSAGDHFITMSRTGYNTWQKAVKVTPGSVLWLNYTRFIPSKLKPATVADFSVVSSVAASPDAKWMAVKADPAAPNIRLANLTRNEVQITTLALPEDSYTAPAEGETQKFTLVKWDPDSRYILVKHMYGAGQEWLIVDSRDVKQTKNITQLLDIEASKIEFDEGNSQLLYVQIGTDVRQIDLGDATLSRPLVEDAAEFSVYDSSIITYATVPHPETKKRSVGYYRKGEKSPHAIRTFGGDDKTPLRVAIGKYFSDMYYAVAHGEQVEILKGELPKGTASNPATLKHVAVMDTPGGAQHLDIKTDGRFVVAQNGDTYKTYDIELKKESATTLKGKAKVARELQWLDNYMVWSDRDGMLRLYEFDGANRHDIMPVVPGLGVTLSPSGKYLYGISKSKDGTHYLTRVQLIL